MPRKKRGPFGGEADRELSPRVLILSFSLAVAVADNRVYRLMADGNDFSEFGPYESEDELLDVLRELNRSATVDWSSLRIHVYETDATPLGIGRRYLGSIAASAVLMAGEVDEERVRE